jgi:ferrous iron transport protein B
VSHDHHGGGAHLLGDDAPAVLLLGRPNAGKSSVYNRLTGAHAKVGNFPGVTVDILSADLTLPGTGGLVRVVDLPGVYSLDVTLDPGTDEGVARSFLDRVIAEKTRAVLVQVLDASQLAAGLALTRELLARPLPLLVVLTQRDVLAAEGRTLSVEPLREALGVPVVAINSHEPAARETLLAAVTALVGEGPAGARPTPSWKAEALAHRAIHDAEVVTEEALERRDRTDQLDRVLLHPVLGPVVFLGLMVGLFAAVYAVADPVSSALDVAVQRLGSFLARPLGRGLLGSFVTDGLLGGAGTVLAFLPQIVILTAAMELLDASGYLARGAFLIDGALRPFGLGGRSFVPMLTAHACAVPAIAATRILRDPLERLTVILVLPLLACSARIPTYGLVLAAFFGGRPVLQATLFVALYLTGIAAAVVVSLVLRRSATKGRRLPLVLEMPAYRSPDPRAIARACYVAGKRFVRDVGTVILACGAVLWVLLHVPTPGAPADPHPTGASAMERSVGASIGRALEPVTRPLGFDWRINVGLLGSFGARELMVGTLGVISGIEDADEHPESLATRLRTAHDGHGHRRYSSRTGVSLLVFFVFACQCMSTLAAIRRETRSWRWVVFVTVYTYALAWVAAFVASRVAGLLGLE